MIIWGGGSSRGTWWSSDAGRFNLTTNAWSAIDTTNAPGGRTGASVVWTGSKLIIWGGYPAADNSLYSYVPGSQMVLYQRP